MKKNMGIFITNNIIVPAENNYNTPKNTFLYYPARKLTSTLRQKPSLISLFSAGTP